MLETRNRRRVLLVRRLNFAKREGHSPGVNRRGFEGIAHPFEAFWLALPDEYVGFFVLGCSLAAAESRINAAMGMGGFGICLLKLVTHPKVDADKRHQASIQFKNLVLQRWTHVSVCFA